MDPADTLWLDKITSYEDRWGWEYGRGRGGGWKKSKKERKKKPERPAIFLLTIVNLGRQFGEIPAGWWPDSASREIMSFPSIPKAPVIFEVPSSVCLVHNASLCQIRELPGIDKETSINIACVCPYTHVTLVLFLALCSPSPFLFGLGAESWRGQ